MPATSVAPQASHGGTFFSKQFSNPKQFLFRFCKLKQKKVQIHFNLVPAKLVKSRHNRSHYLSFHGKQVKSRHQTQQEKLN
jgi:hypothetical protein